MSSNTTFPLNNGAIHNTGHIIKVVMSSAAKVELGMLYINAKFAASIRHMLTKWDAHNQPRHGISLVTRQRVTTAISFLLVTQNNNLCQLLE